MSRQSSLVVAAAVALSSSAFAQAPSHYSKIQNSVSLIGSGIQTGALAAKHVVGDISGHGAGDVVVRLVDGQVCLYFAPGGLRLSLAVPCGPGVTDITIAEPTTTNGQQRIAAANGSGMTFYSLSKNGVWSGNVLSGPNSNLWINATNLLACDANGDGKRDIVGIASDHRTVVIAVNNGLGAHSTITGPTFAQNLSDFAVANLDADPEAEFAGLQPNGIVIRDIQNNITMFARTAFAGAGYCLTTVHRLEATDQVAWLTPDSQATNAPTRLYLVDQLGVEGPIMLNNLVPSCVTAGDFDLDGLDDLLIADANVSTGTLLRRLPGTPSFSLDEVTYPGCGLKISYDGSLQQTNTPSPRGILADLDGDAIPEIVGLHEDSKELRVLMRDAPVKIGGQPSLPPGVCGTDDVAFVGGSFDADELHPSGITYTWTSGAGELQLLIDESAWTAFAAGSVNAFEVHVYRQLGAGTSSMTLASAVNGWYVVRARNSNGTQYMPASNLYNQSTTQQNINFPNTVDVVNVPLFDASGGAMPLMDWTGNKDYRFYIEICACSYDSVTNTVSNRKRIYKYGFAGTEDTVSSSATTADGLITFAAPQPEFSLFQLNCFAALDAGVTGVKVGGAVMMSSLPNFQNQPLVWPNLTPRGFP